MAAASLDNSLNVQAPPTGDRGQGSGTAAAPIATQRLANTGTTESSNATAMPPGAFATLVVGLVAIRVTWRSLTGVGAAVATTDLILPAGALFSWFTEFETQFVYCEAADGASAYEAWVWQSSQ